MILRHFPDHTRPDFNLDAPCPVYGWPNMIIHAVGRNVDYPEHDGTLSIKCAFGGRELYRTGKRAYVVDGSRYLILNYGERYSSVIDSRSDVEAFCVFFRPGFARGVARALVDRPEKLADDPAPDAVGPEVYFTEQLHSHGDPITPMLLSLREAGLHDLSGDGWLEEKLHTLMENLMTVHTNLAAEIDRVPSARPATRIELHRRLHQAREFMDNNLSKPIPLSEIAAVAYLSPHHFLRLFRETFTETPHRYLTRRRLERARHLLLTTELTISEICTEVGFQSPGSFSWLFRRHVGLSPDGFRAQHDIYPRRRSRSSRA